MQTVQSRGISFRARLFWVFLLVIVASLALPTWYSQNMARRELARTTAELGQGRLALLAGLVERDLSFPDAHALESWLARIGGEQGGKLEFLPGASPAQPAADAVGSDTAVDPGFQTGMVRMQRAVTPQGGAPAGILRMELPVSALHGQQNRLLVNVLLGVGLTLLLAVPLCYFISRQLAVSLSGMATVAEAIGKGEYGRRIRVLPGRELAPLADSINNMAASIQTQIQTIVTQKQQLAAILDGMKEGVMVLDDDGRIRAVNRALLQIFPSVAEADGRKPLEAVRDASLQQACDQVLAGRAQGLARPQSLQIEPDRGLVYEVNLVPLAASQAELGAVVVFHDISRLSHLERVRRDFVANVSHELRTPLTSIKGYAETVLEAADSDPRAVGPFLEVILKNANHMTKIVGDLLHLSRLEAGRLTMNLQAVDTSAALASAFKECLPLAQTKQISLQSELPASGPRVQADFDRLVQVFRNLVENAVRHAPAGSQVRVAQFVPDPDGPEGDSVHIAVSDTGPGVPREERERIFERFYRVEKHREKAPGSSGLGLAIVKHIVERHGGRVWVESPARGQSSGASFLFSLKQARLHANDTDGWQHQAA